MAQLVSDARCGGDGCMDVHFCKCIQLHTHRRVRCAGYNCNLPMWGLREKLGKEKCNVFSLVAVYTPTDPATQTIGYKPSN